MYTGTNLLRISTHLHGLEQFNNPPTEYNDVMWTSNRVNLVKPLMEQLPERDTLIEHLPTYSSKAVN